MKAEYLAHMGDDLMVVNCARVSFSKWKAAFGDTDAGLIKYLARHDHWSPFSHPQIQLRITAPMFVARQWFRSTVGVARNEVSRRYISDHPIQFEPSEWRAKPDGSIKQGSGDALNKEDADLAMDFCQEAHAAAYEAYVNMLAIGVAPEQARMILPQSTYTMWIETGSLAYFARICQQRLDPHAQQEIQDLAAQVAEIIEPLFPVSWAALMGAHDDE